MENEEMNRQPIETQPQVAQPQPVAQPAAAAQPQPQPAAQQAYRQPAYNQQPYAAPNAAPYAAPAASYNAPANQVVTAAPQKSHGWIVAIVLILALTALMAFSVHSCTSVLSPFSRMADYGSSEVLTSGPTIAIIEIDGTIQYDGSACSPEGLKELLDEAEADDDIKAVVLRVNSGGGSATAGEEMAEYVRLFSKPIVVSSASVNASAAYEISSQADYIFVARSTEIGAIGTVIEITDLSGLLEKLGVSMDVIASAENKDSTYGYRPLSEDEREYYQDMVNKINDIFIENVAAGRGMSEAEVRQLATGLVFTGVDSVDNGLADAIGTREDAIEKAAELAGIEGEYYICSLDFTYASIYDLYDMFALYGSDSKASDIIDLLKEQPNAVRIR